jgi:ubiquinone/menaquinone biosynthesis C-methylase UbiE
VEKGENRDMESMRKPFQGVLNIIRFNWHFYVIAFVMIFLSIIVASQLENSLQLIIYFASILIAISSLTSLLVSLYVYDLSGLYKLSWIKTTNAENLIVNINAGFDETSTLLKDKFNTAEFIALDFYDPLKHTEISIKRARRAYPAFPKTISVDTTDLPIADNSADKVFVVFSAHEIRNETERVAFFRELSRILKADGQIYMTEHLRDLPNFFAYNFGFLHFYSKNSWFKIFQGADLKLSQEFKLTPFISTFILIKNGIAV